MMQLNHNQLKAINEINQNIVVAASAGGGKTTLLINRLTKRIIKDKISLNEIIAITFTEYAAINMKKRLIKSLKQSLKQANEIEKDFIYQQLSLVDNANISTIHSLCLKIIKEYHLDLNLSLEACNNILNDEFKHLLLNQAFEKTANNFKDFESLLNYLTNDLYHYENLKANVITIINTAINNKNPINWLKSLKNPQKINNINQINPKLFQDYLSFITNRFKLIKIVANQYLLNNNDDNVLNFLKNLEQIEALMHTSYDEFIMSLGKSLTLKIKPKDEEYKKTKEYIAKRLEEVAKYVMPSQEIIKSINQNNDYQALLIDFSIDVYTNYQDIKKKQNCLDFNDIEHFAYKILSQNDFKLAKEYQHKFKEIMVDEFQDTSSLQWEMIQSFAHNNLFIVGDVKQSIYRFRGAKPEILNQIINDPNFLKININENYRSKASIINFNNELFKQAMAISNPELSFKQIIQEVGLDTQKDDNQKIRFIFNSFTDLENDFLIKDDDKEHKVLNIVAEIKRLHQKKVSFKDIVVLVRNHNDKKLIKEVFEHFNIPYFIDDKSSYLNSLGVEIIISYLKLIINPKNKEALISLLISPLYQMDIELLLLQENIFDYLQIKNHPLIQDLAFLNKLYLNNQIFEIIAYILKINHFYFNYLNLQQQTNVDYFIDKIESYQDLSIIEIIALIEKTANLQKDISFAISKEDDVVKVMTIHQSKGLEFDYVILFSKENKTNNLIPNVVVNEKIGIGFDYLLKDGQLNTPSFFKKTINWINSLEEQAEYLRLLYVANTRAVKQIIIIDSELKKEYFNQLELIFHTNLSFSYYIHYMYNNFEQHFEKVLVDDDFNYDFSFKQAQNYQEIKLFDNQAQLIEKISPSKLKDKTTLNLNIKGSLIGTKLHQIMEMIDFKKIYTTDDLIKQYNITNNQALSILNFINDPLIKNYQKVYKEYSFYHQENNNINHGFIDLILEFKDKILIIDYKSDNLLNEIDFINNYKAQIIAYQKIIKNIFKTKKIETYLYSFKLCKFIKINE